MKKKVLKFLTVAFLAFFITSTLSLSVSASPISCKYSLDPVESLDGYDEQVNMDNSISGDVSIQCGTYVWGTIRSGAVWTNSTNKVHNYNKAGGQNQAWSDFSKMPGYQQYVGNGRYIKTSDGKTVTYYRSTSTNNWTLSYPNGTTMTDKIRFIPN